MAWGYSNLAVGSSYLYGLIIVNYPEGSVLTITGGRSIEKPLSTTQKAYYVREAGVYSITSTDPMTGDSTHKEVEITTIAQSITITLSYRLYIVQNGKIQDGFYGSSWYKGYDGTSTGGTSCISSYQGDQGGRIYYRGEQKSNRCGTGYYFNNVKSLFYSNGELKYNYFYIDAEWDSRKSNNVMEVCIGATHSGSYTYSYQYFISACRTYHKNDTGRLLHKYSLNNSEILNSSTFEPALAFNVSTMGDSTCCQVWLYNMYFSNSSEG